MPKAKTGSTQGQALKETEIALLIHLLISLWIHGPGSLIWTGGTI